MSMVSFGCVSRLCVSKEPVKSNVATSDDEDMARKLVVPLARPLRRAVAADDDDDDDDDIDEAATDLLRSIDVALVANMVVYLYY